MKLRSKKLVYFSGALISLLVIAYVWILCYPQSLFRYSFTHRNVSIYSEAEIDPRWEHVIDQSLSIIEDSELMNDQAELNVLLIANSKYRRLECFLASPVLAKASQNNVFLNGSIDFDRLRLIGPVLEMHLVRTLAHEMTHCLENARYGFNNSTTDWKKEGYAEYISHIHDRTAPGYQLTSLLDQYESHVADSRSNSEWIELSDGVIVPPLYVRWRLLVEYLIDIKGMSYDQIRSSQWSDADIYEELQQKFKQKNGK